MGGITLKQKHEVTPEIEAKMCEMYREGHSSVAISKLVGFTPTTVVSVLRRNGVEIRSITDAHTGIAHSLGKKLYERYYHNRGKQLYEGKCVACQTTTKLAVHHVNGNHDDSRDSNLILLCGPCHIAVHRYKFVDTDKILSLSFKGYGMDKIASELGLTKDKVQYELFYYGLARARGNPRLNPMIKFLAGKLKRGEYLYD
jgi:5-methylcytosine-specific restriction endonuclease McrA